jgi:predicted MPP superfamily phosphohydrolase
MGVATGSALVAYGVGVEPKWVETKRISLEIAGLPMPFDGYKIVQISDIHAGQWFPPERIAETVKMVNDEHPDLVVITGDFVTYTYPHAPADIVPSLSELRATDGVIGTLGNHDYWGLGPALIRQVMREAGIIELSNSVHTLERDGAIVHVAGVDSAREKMARLDETLEKLPKEGKAILLAHEPDFADRAVKADRFSLQLSGHSHGGQVVVPLYGPPRLPPLGKKYYAGLYRVGDMQVYTNRGIGVVGIPIRFFCRPEITVITLQGEESVTGH